jgi:hypothetical protein
MQQNVHINAVEALITVVEALASWIRRRLLGSKSIGTSTANDNTIEFDIDTAFELF